MITHTNWYTCCCISGDIATGDFVLFRWALILPVRWKLSSAGAIMVLLVFVVMMLNLGGSEIEQEPVAEAA